MFSCVQLLLILLQSDDLSIVKVIQVSAFPSPMGLAAISAPVFPAVASLSAAALPASYGMVIGDSLEARCSVRLVARALGCRGDRQLDPCGRSSTACHRLPPGANGPNRPSEHLRGLHPARPGRQAGVGGGGRRLGAHGAGHPQHRVALQHRVAGGVRARGLRERGPNQVAPLRIQSRFFVIIDYLSRVNQIDATHAHQPDCRRTAGNHLRGITFYSGLP